MTKLKFNYSNIYDKVQELYALYSYNFLGGKSLLPLRYTLELTYRCNLNCGYCYVGEEKQKSELTTEEWVDLIDQIPPFRLITLVGGEVLLRKDFKTILNKCFDRAKVNIVTNATLIDDELINMFVDKKLLLLSISIDGIGDNHDSNRGVKGTYNKVIRNIEKLNQAKGNKRHPMLDIKTVILENNLDDLVEIYKLADYYRADFFTPAFLKESHLQQNASLRENFEEEFYIPDYPIKPYFDMEHFLDVFRQIKDLSKKSRTRIRFYPKFDPDNDLEQINRFYSEAITMPVQDIYQKCLYPWANVLVTPDGNIYPCLSYKIGNIRKTSIKQVWNSEKFKDFRKELKKNSMFSSCQGCCQLKVKI